jgi:hypothetical protein
MIHILLTSMSFANASGHFAVDTVANADSNEAELGDAMGFRCRRVAVSTPPGSFARDFHNSVMKQAWHTYLKQVYGEAVPVTKEILGNLGWLYKKNLPVQINQSQVVTFGSETALRPAPTDLPICPLDEGTPFQFMTPRTPSGDVSNYGYFVKQRLAPRLETLSRVEVMHVHHQDESRGLTSWFWPLAGTGIFLNLDRLREHGQLLDFFSAHKGLACTRHGNCTYPEPPVTLTGRTRWSYPFGADGAGAEKHAKQLHANQIAAFQLSIAHGWPMLQVSEIVVVRLGSLFNRTAKEFQADGPCIYANLLSTGYSQSLPCVCDPSAPLINCGNKLY